MYCRGREGGKKGGGKGRRERKRKGRRDGEGRKREGWMEGAREMEGWSEVGRDGRWDIGMEGEKMDARKGNVK